MDDDLYANWVRNVKSKFVPLYTIDVIVSNRLEKYRSFTQEWLSRNGINYNKLCLWDVQSKEERGGIEKWVKHKIEVLSAEKPDLMIESDREQAERIWKATGIPVLWYDGKEIIQED